MLKNIGVYTSKCPKCARSILMHLASDGSVSPSECSDCHVEFAGIDNGEQRNTFVVVLKTGKSKIVVNNEAEEKSKESKNSSTVPAHTGQTGRKVPVKSQKDSFKMWKDN